MKAGLLALLVGSTASVLLVMALSRSAAAAEPLAIPDEPLYTDVQWPECKQPAGFYWKPIPADWKALSLEGAWKFKVVPFVKNNENPLDDEGMKAGFFKPEFDAAAWPEMKTGSR